MRAETEVLVLRMLGGREVPPSLVERIDEVESLINRCQESDYSNGWSGIGSRQILAVIIAEWKRDQERTKTVAPEPHKSLSAAYERDRERL